MPTEHEYKYLLSLDVDNEELQKLCSGYSEIQQGYLAVSDDMNLRVRHSMYYPEGEGVWVLTFKQKIMGRQIEVEQELELRDGMDLWEVSTRKLKKVRFLFADGRIVWELDLFFGPDPRSEIHFHTKVYFAMMEVEVNEGAPRPDLPKSLEFLKKHILYEVPLTDDRFSNKNLGDVSFATDLYQQIQQGVD
jgi:CYTH domain-containing protein